jgi:hypothetical protein
VIEGIIYFQEYRELDMTAGIVFFAALLVIFFGVYLLSSGGDSSSKSYAPVPSSDGSEENWDPTDPTTPRCAPFSFWLALARLSTTSQALTSVPYRIITASGVKDLDSGTLEKFGMLLSVSQVAGREAWQVGWLTEQEKNAVRKRSGSSPASLDAGA